MDLGAPDSVKLCAKHAQMLGFTVFALPYSRAEGYNNRYCFTSEDAGETYYRYGPSTKCQDGRGAGIVNSVYEVTSQKDPCLYANCPVGSACQVSNSEGKCVCLNGLKCTISDDGSGVCRVGEQ